MPMEHTLNNGVKIPAVGLGTFRAKENEAYEAVLHALKNGYRHIDTAAIYGNEEQVGKAIRDSGVPRDELFITTKLWNNDQGYLRTKEAMKESLERLGLEYVDLYLIHWPSDYALIADTWLAMEELYLDGFTRAIGVSNFNFHHLEHLLKTAEIIPQVNQVETNVHVQNYKLQEFCMKNGIHLEAYAPLMSHHIKDLLEIKELKKIAKKHGKTIPQVALRFLLQRAIIIIPKSVTPKRIDENLDLFDFELDKEDMKTIFTLNKGKKNFPDPDNIGF
ncbi:MAG: aldo/keto reductase [Candidatus Izemoplasmataceae bacterium]